MPKTYCTYRIKVANRERVQVEKWNSLHQPLGEPSGAFRYLEKLDELTPLLSSALNNELNDSSRVRTLGETLFDILFDDVLRQDFVGFYEQVVHRDKQLLRIELVIDEQGMPEVAALPWEFMCLPQRANLGTVWLSTAPEVVFSRRRSQYFAAEPIQLRKNEKLRIALVVASPLGLPLVAYEPIQQALEKLAQEKAELIELLPVLHSAGLESIDEILSQKPHIVHFMGHCGLQDEQGKETGVIALVDPDSDQTLWVEAGNFSELLNQYRPGLVMLQASQSGRLSASQAFVGVASRVVQQNIPVVVAMQYDVSDTITSRFASRFYKQLAEGDPVDIAAQYGRRAISLSSAQYKKRDFATPVIFMRVENGYLFQTYKEEPPAPSSSVEMRRRLEAAMPQTSQVDRPTEIRVMVALHDSPGLRVTLPDITESGDLIQKNDAVQNDVALEFPVDSKTREPLPINIFVAITAPGFKMEQPAKSIRVSPKYDSGIITFFLTPTVPQKYGRVVVEWFSDEQKNTVLGSLTLITEVLNTQENLSEARWNITELAFAETISATLAESDDKENRISIFPQAQAEEEVVVLEEIVEASKFDLGSEETEESLESLAAIDQSLADLPNGYGESRIVLLPRDPQWAYVYWDVPHSQKEELRRQGGQQLALRLYDVTNIDLNYQSPNSVQEFLCDEVERDRLLPITVENRDYAIEIGYRRFDERWLVLARSSPVRIAQKLIENVGDGILLDMLLIPGGTFIMGSPEEESRHYKNESPQHNVSINGFFIGKYPITQAQWREIASRTDLKVERDLPTDPSNFEGDEHPVEYITWYDAVEFCQRLSQKTGRVYRLPTEAEWEYACRAGSTTPFHFGETIYPWLAYYSGSDSYSVRPKVGSFGIANAFSLCDMHGNVWEWCFDHWHDTYEGSPTDGSAWLTEMGNSPRLIRGGSWSDPPHNCRSARREKFDPDNRSSSIGFRIVCSSYETGVGKVR